MYYNYVWTLIELIHNNTCDQLEPVGISAVGGIYT